MYVLLPVLFPLDSANLVQVFFLSSSSFFFFFWFSFFLKNIYSAQGLSCGTQDLVFMQHTGSLVEACKLLVMACGNLVP